MLREAAVPPKQRVTTRPGRAAKERRLGDKKRRAEVKRTRRSRRPVNVVRDEG
jgi:ribosome-associated protein